MLTKYDGQSITYDNIGNPTSYYNGTRWTFGWEHGRQLASATNGTNTITYGYDANGLRHTKTVDGVEYKYYYAGDKLVRETFGSTVIDFFYDPDGRPYAMKYDGLVLYYVLNQQGDVVRLIDSEGVNYGTYKYDAWGNILQKADTKYINNNPLRYRGYVYDAETELYYCQSRYYDPKIGRFLNADALVSTGQGIIGNNMFVYCDNNPVLFMDSTGFSPFPTTVAISDCSGDLTLEGRLGTYNELRKLTAGNSAYEVHHLVEKRFYNIPGIKEYKNSPNTAPSVILKKEIHKEYTGRARAVVPYGSNYAQMSATTIKNFYLVEYGGKIDWLDFMCSCFE